MLAPERSPLTPKAVAVWTAVLTLILGFWVSALVGLFGRLGPVGFTFWFVPTWIIVLASAWTGRVDRLLPAALATVIVGVWPAYRWFGAGDWATVKAYLVAAGFIDVMVLLFVGMDFAKRRGWLAESSPRRRQFLFGAIMVNALSSVIGWPTGGWHTGLGVACCATTALSLFWPSRRRPVQPNQSITV